tara:strand:+ start:2593 stop:3405 length:813 start_codon:yes stop_codon:yes gene_type:complete
MSTEEVDPEIEVVIEEEEEGAGNDAPVEEAPAESEEQYSSRVQKRISQEVAKRHEAERRSASVEERLILLQQQFEQAQDNALSSGESAIEAQKLALQRDYTDAYNSGDTDAMFSVQEKLTRIGAQQNDFDRHKQARATLANQRAAPPAQPAQPAQTPRQSAEPEARAVDWARKNAWFGQDEAMTGAAYAIHNRLVNTEGYDTNKGEYYDELDKRLKSAFPTKYKRGNTASPVAAVTSGAQPKRVKLNQAQLDICKKLGVTPQQYARYVEA